MKIAKMNPWNWFRKEEERAADLRSEETAHGLSRLNRLHSEIDRMFDGFLGGGLALPARSGLTEAAAFLRPKLDITGTDDAYLISIELPGVEEKDVEVELRGDNLIIRGEKKNEHEEKGENFHRMERSYGSFRRTLSLPDDVDPDKITAEHKSGVLRIILPRKKEALPAGRTIKVDKG